MTWADILAEIKDAANEASSSGRFTDAQYLRKTNMIMREIVSETECLQSSTTATTVDDQLEYAKADDTVKVKSVWAKDASDDDYSQLIPTSMETLSNWAARGIIDDPWMDETADKPTHWYNRGVNIGVYPKFNAAVTAGLKFYYEEQPTEMTATTDVPFNGDKYLYNYHRVIVYGVLANIAPTLGLNTKYWSDKYEAGKAGMKNKLDTDDEDILTFSLTRAAVQEEPRNIDDFFED